VSDAPPVESPVPAPQPESAPEKKSVRASKTDTSAAEKRYPDTYWLLEGVTLLLLNALGGLYVQGEENVPATGPVLMVSNHVSFLDPVSIGDASPRRVVFMAKAGLFDNKLLNFLLRGVDSFPVRRGEADRAAFRTTLTMLGEGRVVCIFPEGTRSPDGELMEAEPGAALFAVKTGCPVVPVYVRNSQKMLDLKGRLHRAKITVAFGPSFTLTRGMEKEGGARMMAEIAKTRDAFANAPARRIWPHWIKKPREGSRAVKG
jgi:1-acyl-sn-glycerol-3-phosphate acyltransferase